jgi:hypothetical protein
MITTKPGHPGVLTAQERRDPSWMAVMSSTIRSLPGDSLVTAMKKYAGEAEAGEGRERGEIGNEVHVLSASWASDRVAP